MDSRAQTERERMRPVIMRIVETIVRELNPQKIVLFGSFAYGEPNKQSDIDLLIVMETKDPFHKRWAKVCRIVREVRKGIPFSPFVITPEELKERLRVGDPFFQEIERRGEVLYER
ncbi:MAG: nucleotidyltransferase domain-containing protein [Candidatus Freyarchaeota archaeon]|nr:nucleotidyltransferase domain-containing protein [Candidatus Jordarchaeia archaeon]MBS7267859.1 nucleotidyltransferase domain-containing protein [Candidatus Jordarchaeia archaeon]MBS7280952.1 nucleotidyltransferase domain-containing protein [Candidatus Jordarchaeia archaeon]